MSKKVTPMIQQYLDIKEKYKDCILFFRLGDFYEMFFEDAEIASKELEITLTGRDCGLKEKAPMCGVPHHSANVYISRLVSKGYKIAICEQIEDPATAKGIVKRDVIKVITPGTVIDSEMLDEEKNNYIMAIYKQDKSFGLSICDVSTGDFYCTSIHIGNTFSKVLDEVAKYMPSEILVNDSLFDNQDLMKLLNNRIKSFVFKLNDQQINNNYVENFIKDKLNCISLDKITMTSVIYLLNYLNNTQKVDLSHIQNLNRYDIDEFMLIDFASRRNLELTETMRDQNKKGSLIGTLDATSTSMGARLLRKWIEQPLVDVENINNRLNSIEELKANTNLRVEIRDFLKKIYDMERLVGKLVVGSVNCRDLIALKNSIEQLPMIKQLLSNLSSNLNKEIYINIDPLQDVYELINKSIEDNPPISIKEGGIIKENYNSLADKFKKASKDGKKWLSELEEKEKNKTGIKNLRIGFNKVFGYFFEVTKSYYNLVPDYFIRKQTLANYERFITEELKNLEETILGSEDKLINLEYELFCEIRETVKEHIPRIKTTAQNIAQLDVLNCLAEIAYRENYCKPVVNNTENIKIKDGRHPVVEKNIENDKFVPNDTLLDLNDNRLLIITGPNMAGKSTYMRQVALIVLMAQIGSFVPASYAEIGVVDKIFTRVGASDDLAMGQSTFMVEMSEVSNILTNATKNSLLILDEIGRGTSTFDGLSIAWSVIEYIANDKKIGARTLFATHYHELTELENKLNGIKNYCISTEKNENDIIFSRKIQRGGANGSYGIEVAKLAGIPDEVILRAREILSKLEDSDMNKIKENVKLIEINNESITDLDVIDKKVVNESENIVDEGLRKKLEILQEIECLNIIGLTPMEVMNALYKIQIKLKSK